MKRSAFIYYVAVGAAMVVVPLPGCKNKQISVLEKPQLLSRICDVNTIIDIGKSYRRTFPDNSRQQLMDNIMAGTEGKIFPEVSSNSSIASFVEEKVKDDFKSGRILVIKGWVLSETEARQCALFSITKQN